MKTQDLKNQKEFEKYSQASIIGRRYLPSDNSWSANLTKQGAVNGSLTCDYIAGTQSSTGKVVTIVTEPFNLNIIWLENEIIKEKTFVIVIDDNDNNHIVLYREDGLL